MSHVTLTSALQSAYTSYANGDSTSGNSHFQQAAQLSKEAEHGIYREMWTLKHKPTGNSEFGRYCFHGVSGLSSTAQERAAAIKLYMDSKGVPTPSLGASLAEKTVTVDSFDAECARISAGVGAAAATTLLLVGVGIAASSLIRAGTLRAPVDPFGEYHPTPSTSADPYAHIITNAV